MNNEQEVTVKSVTYDPATAKLEGTVEVSDPQQITCSSRDPSVGYRENGPTRRIGYFLCLLSDSFSIRQLALSPEKLLATPNTKHSRLHFLAKFVFGFSAPNEDYLVHLADYAAGICEVLNTPQGVVLSKRPSEIANHMGTLALLNTPFFSDKVWYNEDRYAWDTIHRRAYVLRCTGLYDEEGRWISELILSGAEWKNFLNALLSFIDTPSRYEVREAQKKKPKEQARAGYSLDCLATSLLAGQQISRQSWDKVYVTGRLATPQEVEWNDPRIVACNVMLLPGDLATTPAYLFLSLHDGLLGLVRDGFVPTPDERLASDWYVYNA